MKQDARNMDDRQERYELFTLMEGEEKVTMEWDLRLPNTAIFTFSREDHTLGNLLTSALLETEHVLFAAYKVPHPLFPTFILRISTDATIGPKEALTTTCKRVIEDLSSLSKKLTREWELTKLAAAKDGRPDLTEEREQWTERERYMREQRAKHAQWDREQQREQMMEIEEEQRRIHDIEREHAKEIELLRAVNQLRARDNRGVAPSPARHDADPIWERRGGSPERASGGAARSASPPPARWSASPPPPP
ncbi:DNA-directed RNA polymerase, partial [Morchella snyderi]